MWETSCRTVVLGISRRSATIAYYGLFALSLIVSWIFRDVAAPLMEKIPGINSFHTTLSREWFETDAVLQVSLGNFLFFTILAILMIGVKSQKDPRDDVHHGGWMMKIICWCILVIFMFFLPNGIISFYGILPKVHCTARHFTHRLRGYLCLLLLLRCIHRFCPSDEEILQYYLLHRVTGNYILPGIIPQVDLYECNPDHLPGVNMDGEYTYFVTKRDRKYVNGKKNTARITRDGRGYWKSTSKKTKVFAQDGSELGKKTTLKYRFKNSTGGKVDIPAEWIMHEYVISNKLVYPSISSKEDEYYEDIAACRIYKKKSEIKERRNLINSLIGPNLFTIDHNNGEPQPSLKRKFETLITSDQPPDTTMNSNYICDSHAALILDGMRTTYEIGETSNTKSVPPEIGQTSNTNPTPSEIGQTSYTNPTLLEIGQTSNTNSTPLEIGLTSNTNSTPLEIGLTSNTNSTPLEIGKTSNTNSTPLKIVQTSNTNSTPPEFGQTSNTNSTPPQDNIVLTGEGVSVGPTDKASTNIYQNQSNEGKIEGTNLDFDFDFDLDGLDDILLNRSPPNESFEKYWQSLGI